MVAIALLLLMATQFVGYIVCECDGCNDLVCQDFSCCLCANSTPCVLAVSTCRPPSLTLVGLVSSVHDLGCTPETIFELDRPPKSVAA